MPRLTCQFQTIENWADFHCVHPKKGDDEIICSGDKVCPHREMLRYCEIAKTLLLFNIKSIDADIVKACWSSHDCKQDKCYPECSIEGTKEWAKTYKKDFEVK